MDNIKSLRSSKINNLDLSDVNSVEIKNLQEFNKFQNQSLKNTKYNSLQYNDVDKNQ